MSKFIVDKTFWDIFPDAKIGVVLLKDYKNSEASTPEIVEMLSESNKIAKTHLKAENFSDNDVVQTYREAYRKFKTKKGVRSSIESLLKRAVGENPVSSINPLVDIYNSASLRYALPVGAEDKDTFEGDLKLTVTEGGDEFYLIGDEQNSPTLAGEVCYKDDKGAVCRCLNWRDGERTMITDKTTNAFIVTELLDVDKEKDMLDALEFIRVNSEKYLFAKTDVFVMDKNHFEIEL